MHVLMHRLTCILHSLAAQKICIMAEAAMLSGELI